MELLTTKHVAARLKLCQRQIVKLDASGKLPAPVRVGRSVRWRLDDIDRWVTLGCPSRSEFEARQAAGAVR